MVNIEEIDQKLKNSFIAVKKDMEDLKSKTEEINALKEELQDYKTYIESLNKTVVSSIQFINEDIKELKTEIKDPKLKNYKKVLKAKYTKKNDIKEKDKKGVFGKIVDIFSDENDK